MMMNSIGERDEPEAETAIPLMLLQPILAQAAALMNEAVHTGNVVIDATVGNGHDTARLARLVGPRGRVYGFDIQKTAIESASKRLRENELLDRVELFHEGHELMWDRLAPLRIEGRVKAVTFNLGFLPGGDHGITTKPETTIPALEAAMRLCAPGGLITVVLYPGHDGGIQEAQAILNWASQLVPRRALVLRYEFLDPRKPAPILLAIQTKLYVPTTEDENHGE